MRSPIFETHTPFSGCAANFDWQNWLRSNSVLRSKISPWDFASWDWGCVIVFFVSHCDQWAGICLEVFLLRSVSFRGDGSKESEKTEWGSLQSSDRCPKRKIPTDRTNRRINYAGGILRQMHVSAKVAASCTVHDRLCWHYGCAHLTTILFEHLDFSKRCTYISKHVVRLVEPELMSVWWRQESGFGPQPLVWSYSKAWRNAVWLRASQRQRARNEIPSFLHPTLATTSPGSFESSVEPW